MKKLKKLIKMRDKYQDLLNKNPNNEDLRNARNVYDEKIVKLKLGEN